MDREAQRDMAQQMDHSIATADTHYNVGKKYDVTSRFRRALSQVLKIQQNEESDVDDVGDVDVKPDETPTPSPSTLPDLRVPKCNPKKQIKVFSKSDVQQLKTAAGDWIITLMRTGGQIKIKELEMLLKSSEVGQNLLEKFTMKQLYTRCRFTIKGLYKF